MDETELEEARSSVVDLIAEYKYQHDWGTEDSDEKSWKM